MFSIEISKQGLQYESYLLRTFRDMPIISNKKLEICKTDKFSRKCSKHMQILRILNDTRQRLRPGGRYDKRNVRHWGRACGRPVQNDYILLSANDV